MFRIKKGKHSHRIIENWIIIETQISKLSVHHVGIKCEFLHAENKKSSIWWLCRPLWHQGVITTAYGATSDPEIPGIVGIN